MTPQRTPSLREYSAMPNQHESVKRDVAVWQAANGPVPVTIIAYSLGATIAFCIIGLGEELNGGNFACAWLPVTMLQYP